MCTTGIQAGAAPGLGLAAVSERFGSTVQVESRHCLGQAPADEGQR